LTHTTLPVFDERGEVTGSRVVLRVSIGATMTREEHVRGLWELLRAQADAA
jgi:hypothetical protein